MNYDSVSVQFMTTNSCIGAVNNFLNFLHPLISCVIYLDILTYVAI